MTRPVGTVPARAVAAILPRSRPGRLLALGTCLDSGGTGMFVAAATLYFVGVVGIPAHRVAYAATVAGLVALVVQTPLGRVADRLGPGRVYVAVLVLRGLGYAAYALVDGYPAYLVLTVALTALDRTGWMQQALVAEVVGDADRTRTMASIRAVRNVGLTVGFLVASVVVMLGERAGFAGLFLFNGVSFLVFAAVVRRVTAPPTAARVAGPPPAAPPAGDVAAGRRSTPLRSPWFLLFTVGSGVLGLYDTILLVLLPVWVLGRGDIPVALVPVLMAVNTVLTVVLQVPVTRYATGVAGSRRLVAVATAALCGCCVLFAMAGPVAAVPVVVVTIVAAVVLLTVGENLHSAASWELSHEMSPAATRSRHLAVFSLGITGQRIVGPALLVAVVLPLGGVGWLALAAALVLAAVAVRTAVDRGRPDAVISKTTLTRPVGPEPVLMEQK